MTDQPQTVLGRPAQQAREAFEHARHRIRELEEALSEARAWIAEATKTITGLSGGGSENFVRVGSGDGEQYRADLPFCEQRIRGRIGIPLKIAYEWKAKAEAAEARLAQARADALEEAARVAEQEVTTYHEGMSAVDVRLSHTRGPKWSDGPSIANAIRALASDTGTGGNNG
jgi:hypothetical protein